MDRSRKVEVDSDEDDEEQDPQEHRPSVPVIEDEAQVFEGLRAHFPLSFGRQETKKLSLESIHAATKRQSSSSSINAGKKQSKGSLQDRFLTTGSYTHKSPADHNHLDTQASVKRVHGPLPMGSSEPLKPHESIAIVQQEVGGDEGEAMVGPPLPPNASLSKENGDDIGPPPFPSGETLSSTDDEDGDTDGDDEDDSYSYRVPMSNEIVLKGHTKVVSALAVDPTGSRVLTGSYDYSVRMYDFQGMDSRLQSFRQLEPFEGHQVRALSWSPSADRFLCVTGSAQIKIYDRDGLTLGEFLRGDMYIRDLKNTKGHISGLTCGEWHPKEKQTILSSSEDGSLRIWDVNDFKSQKQVIKPKLARPGRVPVTTCAWGMDGKCVAGGLGNGSVQVWNVKAGWGSRPDMYIEKAHMEGEDVSGLRFSADGFTLLSRSLDETLKVWDLRSIKAPVKVFSDLPNLYQQTNVAFSPDEQLILTGTSVEKGGTAGGLLYLFDRRRLELTRKIGVSSHSVVSCLWHQRLNQILATTGDKKEGGTHILYDPAVSERGALVCVARAPRKKSAEDFEGRPVIHHPHALPLFRDEPSRKRQREKARSDPLKSKRPDLPVTGPGFGGRVGTTKGSLLTQYLLKEGGLMKETWMEEDPREAILKYADAAEKDPKYIAPAYAETQPKTLFAASDSEDEGK